MENFCSTFAVVVTKKMQLFMKPIVRFNALLLKFTRKVDDTGDETQLAIKYLF